MVGGGPEEGRCEGRHPLRSPRPPDQGAGDGTHARGRGGRRPHGAPPRDGHLLGDRSRSERYRGPGHGRPEADVMKAKARFLGTGGGPCHFSDESVPIVGVVGQAPSYIEGVLTTVAEVDGQDGTDRIAAMVAGSRHRAGLALIMLDGTAVGGFNVIDMDALHAKVGRPVATVTRRKPDLAAIERALRRRFDDWEDRFRIMRRHQVEGVRVRQGTLWVSYVGTDRAEVDRKSGV